MLSKGCKHGLLATWTHVGAEENGTYNVHKQAWGSMDQTRSACTTSCPWGRLGVQNHNVKNRNSVRCRGAHQEARDKDAFDGHDAQARSGLPRRSLLRAGPGVNNCRCHGEMSQEREAQQAMPTREPADHWPQSLSRAFETAELSALAHAPNERSALPVIRPPRSGRGTRRACPCAFLSASLRRYKQQRYVHAARLMETTKQ